MNFMTAYYVTNDKYMILVITKDKLLLNFFSREANVPNEYFSLDANS